MSKIFQDNELLRPRFSRAEEILERKTGVLRHGWASGVWINTCDAMESYADEKVKEAVKPFAVAMASGGGNAGGGNAGDEIKLNSKERQEYDSLKAQGEKKKIERIYINSDNISIILKLNELVDRVNELTEGKLKIVEK